MSEKEKKTMEEISKAVSGMTEAEKNRFLGIAEGMSIMKDMNQKKSPDKKLETQEGEAMNELKVFNSEEFGDVRTVTINGDPWFVGKDVAAALGFTNPRDAISTHVFDEDKGVESIDTLGGKQKMTVINESGLYALVFGSRLKSAQRFKIGRAHV